MKKYLFIVLAAGFLFFSCTNKSNNENASEKADVEISADEEVKSLTDMLDKAIGEKDTTQLQNALQSVNEKVNTLDKEQASVVLTKIQEYLKAQEKEIKNFMPATSPISSLYNDICTMTNESIQAAENVGKAVEKGVEENVEHAINDVKKDAEKKANEIKSEATKKVNEAQKAVDNKVKEIKETPQKAADAAKKKTSEAIDAAAASAKKQLGI